VAVRRLFSLAGREDKSEKKDRAGRAHTSWTSKKRKRKGGKGSLILAIQAIRRKTRRKTPKNIILLNHGDGEEEGELRQRKRLHTAHLILC